MLANLALPLLLMASAPTYVTSVGLHLGVWASTALPDSQAKSLCCESGASKVLGVPLVLGASIRRDWNDTLFEAALLVDHITYAWHGTFRDCIPSVAEVNQVSCTTNHDDSQRRNYGVRLSGLLAQRSVIRELAIGLGAEAGYEEYRKVSRISPRESFHEYSREEVVALAPVVHLKYDAIVEPSLTGGYRYRIPFRRSLDPRSNDGPFFVRLLVGYKVRL